VLHNAYALEQGIQADTLRLALDSNLNRHLSTQIGGEYISYNDANSGVRADAALGLVLNEHPREFKVTLSGEYRNTHEQSQELGSPIRDINHPYWTPQDYLGTALILDWRHDRSRFHFCGSQRNIYGLQLSLGTNTDSNPSVELKGIWELDFLEYWSLDLEAMIHESREWDAHSLSLGVSYRIN
jgi:hypothetical protein